MKKGNLRDIQWEDLEKVLFWRNQDFIRNVMFNDTLISYEQHITWYNQLQKNPNKICKIFSVDNRDYGVLNITNMDVESNTCEWGFYIGEKNSNKGTGLLLGYTSLNYIFSTLKIRKVWAEVLESNIISRNFHEKLGFQLDGVLRKHLLKSDQYEDVYLYSIFYSEWLLNKEKIKNELEEIY
ncbi:UDP-4-amino-4,6-dideoxy-N-acetyl-beta-L-altrosamine N-acetyltransferase [Ureibacillus sp. Re31]|uniref:UDP-4-amino-4, 6-dideoxy-N-acetyl-beta-L-altrosamine N-acetyltransferase n=1 Tax=Ureibacillus galli TaxID=2762222 RepID=A0ABR8X9C6_9BACL|nr:UDP-4-amino-4,6-dideoxy-N-acetyl-beta-L-altrosamine N-acetyltransferase [Ureibacillus galli]MBD8025401.1 UDP-4-amino-4,6-dideoxy-N-acetyl-beta-L-altrosamine N-acetyltransferase [Ureibacillus galli]